MAMDPVWTHGILTHARHAAKTALLGSGTGRLIGPIHTAKTALLEMVLGGS